MDITKCCGSSGAGHVTTIRLGKVQASSGGANPSRLRWRALWMKFKREKKKLFESPSSPVKASYDPRDYAKNFDQGCAWEDPDNISGSFSVRFADPSLYRGVV